MSVRGLVPLSSSFIICIEWKNNWVVGPLNKKIICKMMVVNHKRGELMLTFLLFIFNLVHNNIYTNHTKIYYDTMLFLILYRKVVGGVTKCTLD